MATDQTDYTQLAIPTKFLPGILGQGAGVVPGFNWTTRGIIDAGNIMLGVGLCIVGLVMVMTQSKQGKAAVNAAVGVVGKVI